MKILTFSTLFPNAESPGHGIFVETRLRHLLNHFPVIKAQVVAPVPWFPFTSSRFGSYAQFARAPIAETRHGIAVSHPRYFQIPKVGMTSAPYLLARSTLPVLRKIIADGFDFDLIDAHYYFPDGVAAAMLGRKLNKPVVVTARGSDLNLIPEFAVPRRMILNAANDVAASITVSAGLKARLVSLGAQAKKIHVLRNGVDLELFRPVDRAKARAQLGWQANKTLLSVGNLLELKGHHLVIEALKDLPDYHLIIIGNGKEEQNLRKCCKNFSVTDRVEFVSGIPQEKLKMYYGAADALILASSREGWANVLLESMACGTPVIATPVGGNPEVVASLDAGVLLAERSASAIASGVKRLFSRDFNRGATRRYAERFDWAEISRMQMNLFGSILAKKQEVGA